MNITIRYGGKFGLYVSCLYFTEQEWTEGSMWAAANIRPYLGFWNIFRESGSNNFPVFVCSFQFPSGKLFGR